MVFSCGAVGARRAAIVQIGAHLVRICEVADEKLCDWAFERCGFLQSEGEAWHVSAQEQCTPTCTKREAFGIMYIYIYIYIHI